MRDVVLCAPLHSSLACLVLSILLLFECAWCISLTLVPDNSRVRVYDRQRCISCCTTIV